MAKAALLSPELARAVKALVRQMQHDGDTTQTRKRSPTSFPFNICAGRITARSGTTNATYDVEAAHAASFTLTGATPQIRQFATSDVTWVAAAVTSECILVFDKEANAWKLFWAQETIQITDCEAVGGPIRLPPWFNFR